MSRRSKTADDIWRALPVDRSTAIDFIGVFARFEYALKRAGFLQDDRVAKPSWKRFEEEIQTQVQEGGLDEVFKAGAYLIEHPTRKQVVRDGTLDWGEPPRAPTPPTLAWLLDVVRTIRNNLFHGGKFMAGPLEDPLRDHHLIAASSDVLLAVLDVGAPAAERVNDMFWRFDGG